MTYIPPQQCPICRDLFTPLPQQHRKGLSKTCGKYRCRGLLAARSENWRPAIARAQATNQAKRRARIAAVVAEQFGELSERELAIFECARRLYYQQGLDTGRQGPRRKAVRA